MGRLVIPGAATLDPFAKMDQRFSIQDTGMIPDCIQGVRGSMTVGSPTLTILAPDTPLDATYIGKKIAVFGAGPTVFSDVGNSRAAGNILLTTITAVAGGGLSCTLGANATHTVSETQWATGTDNTPAFNACMSALRAKGGGVLNWDKPGNYFFASSGYTNYNGWYFVDRIDFSNCHIVQGEHTKIVIGFPMQFLSLNEAVYNKFNLSDLATPPIANITAPVAKGSMLIQCNPAQLVDGGGHPLYHRGDWILIFTGFVLPAWPGFNVNDAQIVQIVFADTGTGLVILAEPTLKPFVQELYPSPIGWTGPVGNAPFGIINITPLLIHDFRYKGLNIDSFFYTFGFYGGQIHGFFLDGVRGSMRNGFYATNYVHTGVAENIRVYIDNQNNPNFLFDYAWTVAVGSSHAILRKSEFNSSGVLYLHVHEGAANCAIDQVRLGLFVGTPAQLSYSINALHIAGRSYGFKMSKCSLSGFNTNAVIFIDSDCVDGGVISDCEIIGRGVDAGTYPFDVECFGKGWRIDCPLIDQSRIYLTSPNAQPPFVTPRTDVNHLGVEGVAGLLSPYGGLGQRGNILTQSDNLTLGSWVAGAGVTVTPNTTDIPDPVGTHTASKIVTGATSANMEVAFDSNTPAPGLITGAGNNGNRSFVLSFYVYSPIENRMEAFVGSFNIALDMTNTASRRVPVYPKWQRVDITVNFNLAAAAASQILVGIASALATPVVGLNSTFYVWGVTLQEVSEHRPLITRASGAAQRYLIGEFNTPGNAMIGPIVDDGVSPVQIAGQVNLQGKALISSAILNGMDITLFRNIASGAHWNGAQWIADATSAVIVQILNTQFILFFNSGLTIGAAFVPTAYITLAGGVLTLNGSFPPGGAAGGDLSGTYPNPGVAKIQGRAVLNAGPADGNVLTWVAANSDWEPVAPATGVTSLRAVASALLTLSGVFQDVPSATVTLNKTGTWLVIGTFEFDMRQDDGQGVGQLLAGGVAQAGLAVASIGTAGASDTIVVTAATSWVYAGANGDIVKLQGRKLGSGAGSSFILSGSSGNTQITAVFLHP